MKIRDILENVEKDQVKNPSALWRKLLAENYPRHRHPGRYDRATTAVINQLTKSISLVDLFRVWPKLVQSERLKNLHPTPLVAMSLRVKIRALIEATPGESPGKPTTRDLTDWNSYWSFEDLQRLETLYQAERLDPAEIEHAMYIRKRNGRRGVRGLEG